MALSGRFFSFLWTDTKLRWGLIKMKNPKSRLVSIASLPLYIHIGTYKILFSYQVNYVAFL